MKSNIFPFYYYFSESVDTVLAGTTSSSDTSLQGPNLLTWFNFNLSIDK